MQREEPTSSLVHTFVDKVTGEGNAFVNEILVLKRIVYLGIRHRTRVKPDVNQVALTLHGLTILRHQYDMVNIRTMEVNLVVVLFRHVTRHETVILQRIALHESSLHSLFDFVVELLHRTDTDLLAIFVAPDGQWCSPETATREVPVIQILQPVTETACSS